MNSVMILKMALLWGLLFMLLKRVSAQMSFRTCKRRYALLRADQVCSRVSNKIPNCSAWQTAKWERQVEGLISEAVQQRPPIRNAFHFWKTCLMRFNGQRSLRRWNTLVLAASEWARRGMTSTESRLSYPIYPIYLSRNTQTGQL